jgi:peptidoglycan/xylan/chitin deacetylase (PgdA/CDA1 family)
MFKVPFKTRMFILAMSISVFGVLYAFLFRNSANQAMNIVLRYDDYCNTSSLIVERDILRLIDEHGISVSFGVIPFENSDTEHIVQSCVSESKIELLSSFVEQGSVEIAQHGFVHRSISADQLKTEFKGLSADEQEYMIGKARNQLESDFRTDVSTFIPPWNSYDEKTLKALKNQGFQIISADNGQVSKIPELNYIPFTLYLDEFQAILESDRLPVTGKKSIAILMLHDYDFIEINPERGFFTLTNFDELIDKAVKSGWKFISLKEAVKDFGPFDQHQYVWNHRKNAITGQLSFLNSDLGIFRNLDMLDMLYTNSGTVLYLGVMEILMYLIIFIVVAELVLQILDMLKIRGSLMKVSYITALSGIAISLFLFFQNDSHIGKYESLMLFVIIGTWMGIGNSWKKNKFTLEMVLPDPLQPASASPSLPAGRRRRRRPATGGRRRGTGDPATCWTYPSRPQRFTLAVSAFQARSTAGRYASSSSPLLMPHASAKVKKALPLLSPMSR